MSASVGGLCQTSGSDIEDPQKTLGHALLSHREIKSIRMLDFSHHVDYFLFIRWDRRAGTSFGSIVLY